MLIVVASVSPLLLWTALVSASIGIYANYAEVGLLARLRLQPASRSCLSTLLLPAPAACSCARASAHAEPLLCYVSAPKSGGQRLIVGDRTAVFGSSMCVLRMGERARQGSRN